MKTVSTTMPQSPYEVELNGDFVDVLIFENVESSQNDDGDTVYKYDLYRIPGLKNRPALINAIERDIDGWANMAREMEYKKLADAIRIKRNELLSETDWTQTTDAPLSEDKIEKYRIYRQALRDMPEQPSFPYGVEWPVVK